MLRKNKPDSRGMPELLGPTLPGDNSIAVSSRKRSTPFIGLPRVKWAGTTGTAGIVMI